MVNETMYQRYCTLHSVPMAGYKFFALPYHERLRLAGYGVLIFASVKKTACEKLSHHPRAQVLPLPALSPRQIEELPSFGLYLLGSDGIPYPVFSYETEIVELNAEKLQEAIPAAKAS